MSKTPTVLLVDDAPLNLETLSYLLMKADIAVLSAENGRQALERATEAMPDLILMDIMMPDMDGFEACRRLQQQERTRDIPVIFITSLIDERSTLEGFEAGGVDYIVKPFNQRETLARIKTHLALRQLRRELEAKNAALLNEIARREQAEAEQRQLERQLRQSQRLEALGTLAGGIAHDFNNILGTMQGYTEFLLGKQPEHSVEKIYLERILTAGNRAAALVKRLLTFSRAHEQHLQPTRLPPIVAEALDMLRATIPATIEVRRHLPAECPLVLADAAQLHQIVVNLCINASQAMFERGGILEIGLETAKSPDSLLPEWETAGDGAEGAFLVLTVRDTGCGMPPEVQERIFDPFFTTRAAEGGTGLGLSVVHGIVQGHQGMLRVESAPGAGTAVRVYFPIYRGAVPDARPNGASSSDAESQAFAPAKGRILLVDDEVDLADILATMLTNAGYHVEVRHAGAAALELFRARPADIDLVLTDHAMPGMNGAQLSRELLTIRPDLPIIMTTGYSAQMSPDQAAQIGIRHFLTKPATARHIEQVIRQVLEEQNP